MIIAALWFLGIIYVIACGWLILIVLLQEGKSGGMSSADSITQAPSAISDSFGAGGSQKGLFNLTSATAAIFLVVAVALTLLGTRYELAGGNAIELEEGTPAASAPAPGSAAPAPAPGTGAPASE